MSGRRSTAGMTLVEIIVMLGIVSIFGAIAYPMVARTMRGIHRNQQTADGLAAGRAGLRALSAALRQIAPHPKSGAVLFRVENDALNEMPRDRLQFTALDASVLATGATATVEYFVAAPDPLDGVPHQLVKRLTAADGTTVDVAVADHVVGFDCQFRQADAWVDTWEASGVPGAVRVTLFVEGHGRSKPLYTVVNLREVRS